MLAGLALAYMHFYMANWTLLSPDPTEHQKYVAYIATHHAVPGEEQMAVARHLPVYYAICALFYKAAAFFHAPDPVLSARHASMAMYLVFITIAAVFLRRQLGANREILFITLAMLAFWPIGVTMGSRITPDVLVYIGQMGVIYSLACFLERYDLRRLTHAFYFSALGVLAKFSAVTLIGLTLAFLLFSLWQHRRQLRVVLRPQLLLSVTVAIACAYFSLASDFYKPTDSAEELTHYSWWDYAVSSFYFNPYLFLQETIINQHQAPSQNYFWHWFMRSLLLGDFIAWNGLAIVLAIGFVWLCMLVYVVAGLGMGLVASFTRAEKTRALFLFVVCGMLVGMLMAARIMSPHNYGLADARYVQPVMVIFLVLYGKCLSFHANHNRMSLYLAGRGLALSFVLLTLALFACQDFLMTKPG